MKVGKAGGRTGKQSGFLMVNHGTPTETQETAWKIQDDKQELNMKIRKAAVSAMILCGPMIFAGCAKNPDQIAAADIGETGYDRLSCQQLATERIKVSQALENLSANQKAAATGDAWGVFLLGLPLSSLSGNDKEAAIAVAKGRLQEIERHQQAKTCIT